MFLTRGILECFSIELTLYAIILSIAIIVAIVFWVLTKRSLPVGLTVQVNTETVDVYNLHENVPEIVYNHFQ